jgi:hypothetical protein
MLLKKTSTNRRRQKRQLLNTSVQIFTGSSHVHALGINLSDFGMCLFTIANLALESEIELEFVPPRSNAPVRVFGTIRHRALYLYGIEFLVGSDQRPSSRQVKEKTHVQQESGKTNLTSTGLLMESDYNSEPKLAVKALFA